MVHFVFIIPGSRVFRKYICWTLPGCHSVNIFSLNSSLAFEAHLWFINTFIFLVCFSKCLGCHSENFYGPFRWWKLATFCHKQKRHNPLSQFLSHQFQVRFDPHLQLFRNEGTMILLFWTSLVIGRKTLDGPGWVRFTVS